MYNVYENYQEEIMENYPMIKIEKKIENLKLEIYEPEHDDVVQRSINNYNGKWLVLFFYPADFTFVCPTELKDLMGIYTDIMGFDDVIIMVASTDSVYSHKRFIETEKMLNDFKIPMISDRTTILSRYLGILNEETGNSERGTFIINPDGILKYSEVITESVGRSSKGLLRKIKALKFVEANPDFVCPSSWDEELPVIKPSIKIAGNVSDSYKVIV